MRACFRPPARPSVHPSQLLCSRGFCCYFRGTATHSTPRTLSFARSLARQIRRVTVLFVNLGLNDQTLLAAAVYDEAMKEMHQVSEEPPPGRSELVSSFLWRLGLAYARGRLVSWPPRKHRRGLALSSSPPFPPKEEKRNRNVQKHETETCRKRNRNV